MKEYPPELRYSTTHEWVRMEDPLTITVGITAHAQHLLGDLVFVELPTLHKKIGAGKEIAVVESVKAAADVYSPVSGEVIAINDALNKAPETVNKDPYGEGWLFKLRIENKDELDALLDSAGYRQLIEK